MFFLQKKVCHRTGGDGAEHVKYQIHIGVFKITLRFHGHFRIDGKLDDFEDGPDCDAGEHHHNGGKQRGRDGGAHQLNEQRVEKQRKGEAAKRVQIAVEGLRAGVEVFEVAKERVDEEGDDHKAADEVRNADSKNGIRCDVEAEEYVGGQQGLEIHLVAGG